VFRPTEHGHIVIFLDALPLRESSTEAMMLQSLQPEDFVLPQHLQTPWDCPECGCRFLCEQGVMSLTHYRLVDTKELKHGLACFCSTACPLRWEQPEMLGRMH
jgi:hypothetical protein